MIFNFSANFLCIAVRYFSQKLNILLCSDVFLLLKIYRAWVTSLIVVWVQSCPCAEFVVLRGLGLFLHRPYFFPKFIHFCYWCCFEVYFIVAKFSVEPFEVGVEQLVLLKETLAFFKLVNPLSFC